jgi:hypothetical protein
MSDPKLDSLESKLAVAEFDVRNLRIELNLALKRELKALHERDEARAEVERLRDVVETLEEDFARRQAAHRCATWDDGQGKCECNNLARTVAERQREACAKWLLSGIRRGFERDGFGPDEVELAEQIIRVCRATPLVTDGSK